MNGFLNRESVTKTFVKFLIKRIKHYVLKKWSAIHIYALPITKKMIWFSSLCCFLFMERITWILWDSWNQITSVVGENVLFWYEWGFFPSELFYVEKTITIIYLRSNVLQKKKSRSLLFFLCKNIFPFNIFLFLTFWNNST